MAYTGGRTRMLKQRGSEEAFERKRYEDELDAAESAQQDASVASTLWQGLGSLGLGTVGLFTGGLQGAYKGFQVGKEVGRWGKRTLDRLLGTGYDPEDYAISTDVGKFGQSQEYALEDINRQFEEAEESRFWQDITGTGVSVMSYLKPPEDLAGKEWWKGKEFWKNWSTGTEALPDVSQVPSIRSKGSQALRSHWQNK